MHGTERRLERASKQAGNHKQSPAANAPAEHNMQHAGAA